MRCNHMAAKLTMLRPRLVTLPTAHRQAPPDRIRGGRLQAMRERVMRRDGGLCQPCRLLGLAVPAIEVDHVRPLWDGGADRETNMQAICVPCHLAKSAAEARRRSGGG